MNFKKFVLPAVVIGGIIGAIVFLSAGGGREKTQIERPQGRVEVGSQAPNFTLNDFSGNQVSLSRFLGKPVFIDFWASWCPPCVEEIPEIEKIHREFPDLIVLGIHRTETEGADIGSSFARKLGATYILLEDSDGEVYKTMTSGQRFMPYSVFIDKNGVIVDKKAGSKTPEDMRERVLKII